VVPAATVAAARSQDPFLVVASEFTAPSGPRSSSTAARPIFW
jgi:hypothetical protein